jgi:hypothetical protein
LEKDLKTAKKLACLVIDKYCVVVMKQGSLDFVSIRCVYMVAKFVLGWRLLKMQNMFFLFFKNPSLVQLCQSVNKP